MAGFRLLRNVLALLAVVAVVLQGTLVLAGTTGALSGTLIDDSSKKPIAGARVNAVSPGPVQTPLYGKLGLDQFPNVDFPFVVVTTRLDGAAPAAAARRSVHAGRPVTLSGSAGQAMGQLALITSRLRSASSWFGLRPVSPWSSPHGTGLRGPAHPPAPTAMLPSSFLGQG